MFPAHTTPESTPMILDKRRVCVCVRRVFTHQISGESDVTFFRGDASKWPEQKFTRCPAHPIHELAEVVIGSMAREPDAHRFRPACV